MAKTVIYVFGVLIALGVCLLGVFLRVVFPSMSRRVGILAGLVGAVLIAVGIWGEISVGRARGNASLGQRGVSHTKPVAAVPVRRKLARRVAQPNVVSGVALGDGGPGRGKGKGGKGGSALIEGSHDRATIVQNVRTGAGGAGGEQGGSGGDGGDLTIKAADGKPGENGGNINFVPGVGIVLEPPTKVASPTGTPKR